jgi:hypothetical protein
MDPSRDHMKRLPSFCELDHEQGGEKDSESIKVGICAMAKKAKCGPMNEILSRLNVLQDFEIVTFSESTILNEPIEVQPYFV